MIRRLSALLLGSVLLLGVGCGRGAAADQETKIVVEGFLAARAVRNLDAMMDCFAERPEMHSSLGVGWTGRDAVRAIMAYRLTDTYTVGDLHVSGNRATWTEQVRRVVAGSPPATFEEDVEAVVEGGRIASLVTYMGGSHPSATVEATPQLSPTTDLLVPISIALLMAAVLVWPPAETPFDARRAATGHLLNGLRDYVARRG
jgi:SnoaL-like domain